MQTGYLFPGARWSIGIVLPQPLKHDVRATTLCQAALDHLNESLVRLSRLYGTSLPLAQVDCQIAGKDEEPSFDLLLGPADGSAEPDKVRSNAPRFLISDSVLPVEIRAPLTPAEPIVTTDLSLPNI